MTKSVRAIRGAITVDVDEREHVLERSKELLTAMIQQNDLDHDDLISIIFTTTPDLRSVFPAVAARDMGLYDVPLMCAQEIDVAGAMKQCLRIMLHTETTRLRADIQHVYLGEARSLRDDIPQKS